MAPGSTLILGIGNRLLSDQAAGIHALKAFRRACPKDEKLSFIDGGNAAATLETPIAAAAQLIVFDAAEFDAEPGTVRCLLGEEMDEYLRGSTLSIYETGLAEALNRLRSTGRCPARRALIGIQPQNVEWGEQLSQAVVNAIPWATALARELLGRWESPDASPDSGIFESNLAHGGRPSRRS